MPFLEHLRELRGRIVVCLVAVIVCFIAAWVVHEEIFDWLSEPYCSAIASLPLDFTRAVLASVPGSGVAIQEATCALHQIEPAEAFFVYLKASLLIAVIVAVPIIFWQMWLFIAPGLYQNERRLAAPFVIGTTFFFYIGTLFCRYIVLEPAMKVLLGIGVADADPIISMQGYFGLTSRFLLVFGAVFETPIIISFLALFGFVTHVSLIKHWRVSLISAFVLGAMLTPPDPFTQTVLALPLIVLYVFSIGVAYVFAQRRMARLPAVDDEFDDDDGGDDDEPDDALAGLT